MRHTIGAWLRRLAEWVDPTLWDEIDETAERLARAAEEAHGAGFGEAKRHQVYARLIKVYPTVSKRLLSRAIEDAVERIR